MIKNDYLKWNSQRLKNIHFLAQKSLKNAQTLVGTRDFLYFYSFKENSYAY